MTEFQRQLDALTIKRANNDQSGIDWQTLSEDVEKITKTLKQEAGATPALGHGLRAITKKKAELLRNFKL